QTAPEPSPTPDVALFLHGPGKSSADVHVCWRGDLPLEQEESWLDTLAYCPPSAPECLPVPLSTFWRWLGGEDSVDRNDADVEGAEETQEEIALNRRKVVRWRGRNDSEIIHDSTKIRPGDVIVIPAEYAGWNVLGDLPTGADGQPIADWGDLGHRLTRAKAVLRLHTGAMSNLPETPVAERLRQLAVDAQQRFDDDPHALAEDLRKELKKLAEDVTTEEWGWLREIAAHLAEDQKLVRGLVLHPAGGLIVRGSRHLSAMPGSDAFSDEDDATASSGTKRICLNGHLDGVATFARRFSTACGLPESLRRAVELAGHAHDLGKADPRFQTWLKGGNPWGRSALLAKSEELPQGREEIERARARAGYPKGGRHELLSTCLLKSAQESMPEDRDLLDLVIHLVATHHGCCRPLAPFVTDDQPVPVQVDFNVNGKSIKCMHSSATSLERLDSGVAERFWRLTRLYGWWGLAWLEAILRLADHRCSEAEQLDEAAGGDHE
ncbi:MAG: CRISPR-associated endonuclease Cas3'', partial [Syntrophales bacterium]